MDNPPPGASAQGPGRRPRLFFFPTQPDRNFFINISQKYLTPEVPPPGLGAAQYPPLGRGDSGAPKEFSTVFSFFFCKYFVKIFTRPGEPPGPGAAKCPPPLRAVRPAPPRRPNTQFPVRNPPQFFFKYFSEIFILPLVPLGWAEVAVPPPEVRNQAPPAALLFIFYFLFCVDPKAPAFLFFFVNISTKYLICTQAPGWVRHHCPPPFWPASLGTAGSAFFFRHPRGPFFFF